MIVQMGALLVAAYASLYGKKYVENRSDKHLIDKTIANTIAKKAMNHSQKANKNGSQSR